MAYYFVSGENNFDTNPVVVDINVVVVAVVVVM